MSAIEKFHCKHIPIIISIKNEFYNLPLGFQMWIKK